MLATVGPGMGVQLVALADEAVEDRFRTLFEQWVFPALEAATRADAGGTASGVLREVRLAFDTAR